MRTLCAYLGAAVIFCGGLAGCVTEPAEEVPTMYGHVDSPKAAAKKAARQQKTLGQVREAQD